ncbi:hypothetical protein KI387_026472, partial [Taxus chinensis]
NGFEVRGVEMPPRRVARARVVVANVAGRLDEIVEMLRVVQIRLTAVEEDRRKRFTLRDGVSDVEVEELETEEARQTL